MTIASQIYTCSLESLCAFARDRSGGTTIENTVLGSLLAIVVISGASDLGPFLLSNYSDIQSDIAGSMNGAGDGTDDDNDGEDPGTDGGGEDDDGEDDEGEGGKDDDGEDDS